MGFGDEPKNLKVSIHNKYKRRLKSLSRLLDDFIFHADQKLDRAITGNIHHREDIKKIVAKCRELAVLLPDPADLSDNPPIWDDFLEVLENSSGNTEKIMAEAEEFFNNLSKEEWEEMQREFNKNT